MSYVKFKIIRNIRFSKNLILNIGTHTMERNEFYSKCFTSALIKTGIITIISEWASEENKPKQNFAEQSLKIPYGEPLVSICCLTYNHQHCIEDALKGFLMQKTDFPFEIIVYDDASTDRTASIIEEYAKKYEGIIFPVLNNKNVFSETGILPFATHLFPKAKGKFIAECDGDDYWTDSLKLQKQIDCFKANPKTVLCYHDLAIYYQNSDELIHPYNERPPSYKSNELIGFEKYKQWLHPSTKMWRNLFYEHRKDFETCWGDNATNVLLGMYGDCKYVDGIAPSVFRRFHGNNMWSCMSREETFEKTKEVYTRLVKFMESKNHQAGIKIRKEILNDYIAEYEKSNRAIRAKVHGRIEPANKGRYRRG